jgi:ADP-ribosyl-[dinitrogen reductase] hydrolase
MSDKIKGALYGIAVGDALGACWEGWRPKDIRARFGTVTDMQDFGTWRLGEYTDDTWLTLATARAYDGGEFSPSKAGLCMVIWMRTNGRGIGGLTNKALSNLSSGRTDVYQSGHKALASSGTNRGAGNGSLMRCISTGLVRDEIDKIVEESTVLSEITHTDKRCVAACVGYNIIVSGLLEGKDFHSLCKVASNHVDTIDKETSTMFYSKWAGAAQQFDINDMSGIGYVLRALDRSLVSMHDALVLFSSFEDEIVKIANEGGDADTNAAIAGGLLGAHYGYKAIPKRWIDTLIDKNEIDDAYNVIMKFREGKSGV